jgi:hypothetical protein
MHFMVDLMKEVKTGVCDSSPSQPRSLLAQASTSTSQKNILKCCKVQSLGGKISDKPKAPLSSPLTLVRRLYDCLWSVSAEEGCF